MPTRDSLASSVLVSLLLLPALNLPHLTCAADDRASVTIDQLPEYSYQRSCGRGCIQNNYGNGPDIEGVLGCTWNGCYCATQYRATATMVVRNCWSASCGTASPNVLYYDIRSALDIFYAYCSMNGYPGADGVQGAWSTAVTTTGGGDSKT